MARQRIPLEDRFWAKVDKTGGPDACWPWTAGTMAGGYGAIRMPGGRTTAKANRVAWELTNGPIPHNGTYHGTCVCHTCDNRICCNPKHLWLGTASENNRDKVRKGRQPKGDATGRRKYPDLWPKGERAYNAKLTTTEVLEIRRRYAAGGVTFKQLGSEFGVHEGTISGIIHRYRWKHI